jgi:fatty-acyl-CoA synthase
VDQAKPQSKPGERPSDDVLWGWLGHDPLVRHAKVRPDALACAVLAEGRRLSYRELDAEVERCAEALALSAPERGGRVALLARNSLEHAVLFFATARAGLVFVPLNWRLPAAELRGLLEDAEPYLLIADAEFEPCAREAVEGLAVAVRPIADPFPTPRRTMRAWVGLGPEEPWVLLYTSGTTGRPKGAVITRRSAAFSALNFIGVGEVAPGCATLADAPMFHTVGLFAITHAGLTAGASVLISDRFVPEVTLQRLSDPRLGVTHYFCVPQMARALVDSPAYGSADLTRLKGFFTGGAPLPPTLAHRLIDDGVPVSNGYGSTEGATVMHVPLDPGVRKAKVGACGLPAPAIEVRLVGVDGQDVGEGEVGEVWLRGPAVTPGYWRQPEATAAAFQDGWFKTGDAGRRDADGFYSLVDRWKDMYISGGENVYPAEVEAALLELPGVGEAAVVGAPDERWGEVGVAFLVRSEPALDEAAVLAFCKGRLAGYKRPAEVRFVDALPRNAAGKVRKQLLRADAQQRLKPKEAAQ